MRPVSDDGARRDGGIDVKGRGQIALKIPDFRHFLDLGSFKQVEMVLTLR